MITKIEDINKQPALAELLLVLMANQNTYMSTIALQANGILVDVNYPDRSATTILAGGSGE